eukprot:NODE_5521_length_644_cov_17.696325_g5357_i0.p1 GENE.NODE_5521_length_644_cov_17.696325_g5357_i0~~NODE_5521_length_644_cov_17.696325_g5357_i0.p1  ORF type:complete len:202 (+),score=51.18 NODE_5521_length_644_cov_17.696325_g5357_i0:64-606(+)
MRIVGIVDRNGGVINEKGFTSEEVAQFVVKRNGNQLNVPEMMPFDVIMDKIWDVPADIFIPAAASRLVERSQLDRMLAAGLKVISCGANVPFKDPEIFLGETGAFADSQISVIPDFIANCGMARVFAYLMGNEVEITDHAIFLDTSTTVRHALEKIHDLHGSNKTGITNRAFEIALKQLV